jgi:hypothetical protein
MVRIDKLSVNQLLRNVNLQQHPQKGFIKTQMFCTVMESMRLHLIRKN